MEVSSYKNGVPSWVDHSGPEPEKAIAFYSGLFGWDVQVGPPEAGGYGMATKNGKPVAGIGGQMQPGPASWNTYVNVDSADDAAARAAANGGTVLAGPMDVMTFGRMAFIVDPTGAVIGLWQPGDHPGAALVNEVGTVAWNELITPDVDAALAFYPAVFGWNPNTHEQPDGSAYTEWNIDDRPVGGMMKTPPGMPAGAPPQWVVYFVVTDTDAAVAKAQELGGQLYMPPTEIPQGRIAVLGDPQGAGFSIIALASGPE